MTELKEYSGSVDIDLETDESSHIESIKSFLSDLKPGVSVVVERIRPTWCRGFLEEIDVTDEGLDLSYLVDQWGGHLLGVKVRGPRGQLGGTYKVPLYSYQPRVRGRRIRKGEELISDDDGQRTLGSPVVNVAAQNASLDKLITSALPAILPIITKMMDSAEQKRQTDMAMMMQMMTARNSGGLSDITKIGAVMTQLQEMFRSGNPQAVNESSDMDFMGQALDVIKMVMDKPKLQPPPPPRLTPPKKNEPPKNIFENHSDEKDLAAEIASLDPRTASETIISALGMMSPEQQQAAMSNFIGEFNSFMVQNDGGEDDD